MAFDVIVCGAGIIGSSIAWRLAQRRVRVLLLDAGRVGSEASSAGAGMLAPGGEIEERNDLALDGLRLYPAFVAELQEQTGIPIDFQRLGAVELAATHQEWAALQGRSQRQSALGIASCPLSAEDLRKHVPLARPEVAGALFYPQDALVDPRDIMTALRVACLAGGVDVREGVRVRAIHPGTDTVRVETSEGEFEGWSAVLAAGAWSSEIHVPDVDLPRAFPIRGHLVGYSLAPHSLGPILRHGHTYILQRTSGFTIAGTSSEEAGFDRGLNPAILSDVRARAQNLMPALEATEPADAWLGFRPAVDRDHPVIERAAHTTLWLAYGHYRNGILMAPPTAQRVAQGITASGETGSSAPPGRL